jgi:hypothetical protein
MWTTIVDWVFSIFVVVMWGTVCMITASRPANDRDAMLQGLPPATEPMSLRVLQLNVGAKRIARRPLLIGPIIGFIFLVVGLAFIADQAPFEVSTLLGVVLFAATIALIWEVLVVTYLIAQYFSAMKRLLLDARSRAEMSDE